MSVRLDQGMPFAPSRQSITMGAPLPSGESILAENRVPQPGSSIKARTRTGGSGIAHQRGFQEQRRARVPGWAIPSLSQ
jgi:hypothetical protein